MILGIMNCKVELKLKWTKYCVLSEAGGDNDDVNSKNIILTIKQSYLILLSLCEQKTTKNFQNVLAKSWNLFK